MRTPADLEAELKRIKGLARVALDALNAELEPDYEVGHDKAVDALLAIYNKRPAVIDGRAVTLEELRHA